MLRLWYLLRYHRPTQLVRRAAKLLRRYVLPIGRNRRYLSVRGPLSWRKTAGLEDVAAWRLAQRRDGVSDRARGLLTGRVSLLGETRDLASGPAGAPIAWRGTELDAATRLWRFHLHYHEFLLDLAAADRVESDRGYADRAWAIVFDWIGANRPDERPSLDDAWHPFCISRRIPAWVALASVAPPPSERAVGVMASLAAQANFLADHLERDLGGNHLLENARALALAAAALDSPDARQWLEVSESVLRSELPEQVLPHGEHFERSPGYHAEMLELLLDVRDALDEVRPELSRDCGRQAGQMARFLARIVHPDGDIPLLADSTLLGAERVNGLLRRAAATSDAARPGAGQPEATEASNPAVPGTSSLGPYWTFRDGDDLLLFDAGPVGADHLPAHAHADLLTVELSVAGRRVLVDAGVFDYDDSPMRRYCRSSLAHNVPTIDGAEQCDLWGTFRMGYRGHPGPLRAGHSDGLAWASATHNAYRRRGVPRVGRWIGCRPGGPWLIVDWAEGRGHHALRNRLRVHPRFQVELVDGAARLSNGEVCLWIAPLGRGALRLDQGWYCPRFGERHACPVLLFETDGALPHAVGWMVLRSGEVLSSPLPQLETGHWPDLRITWPGREEKVSLSVLR